MLDISPIDTCSHSPCRSGSPQGSLRTGSMDAVYRAIRGSLLTIRRRTPQEAFIIPAHHFTTATNQAKLKNGRLVGFYHSHPDGAPASAADKQEAATRDLLSILVRKKKVEIIQPEFSSYTGRVFVYGVTDCFSLVADWYKRERQIDLPDLTYWPGQEAALIQRVPGTAGFVQVPKQDVQEGDLAVMNYVDKRGDHLGVFTQGGNFILHHLPRRLSTEQPVAQWQSRILRVLRYTRS